MALGLFALDFTSGAEATRLGYRKYVVLKSLLVGTETCGYTITNWDFAKDLTEDEALRDELVNFQRHVSQVGRAIFEARSGRHLSLVRPICPFRRRGRIHPAQTREQAQAPRRRVTVQRAASGVMDEAP